MASNNSFIGALLPPENNSIIAIEDCEKLNETVFNSTNITCLEHAPQLTNGATIRAVVLFIMAILSFVGNTLTIASIQKTYKRRRSHTVYALILHLSVADLLVTLFCIFGEAIWTYTIAWFAGNVGCKLFKFAQMLTLYLSTFILVLIGVDRFIAVRYPIKAISTAKKTTHLVAATYVLSAILSVPQLFIFRVAKGPFIEDFYQCVTYGFYSDPWQEQLYTTFSFVCMFLLPLLILISTYSLTILTIAQSDKMFKEEQTASTRKAVDFNRRKLIHKAKMKSFRISLVIVATFIIWWTPYYTMMIIFMFTNPDKHLSDELQKGIFFFGMSNSLMNPLIYGAFHLKRPKKKDTSRGDVSTTLATGSCRGRERGILRDEDTTVVLIETNQPTQSDSWYSRKKLFNRSDSKQSHGSNAL